MSKIIYSVNKDIAVITLNNPPLNTFSWELRKDLVAAVEVAELDSTIKAIIIIGSERAFSSGAEISELFSHRVTLPPDVPAVADALELCSKPTIAAISGVAFGGGMEPALGCHYRVAAPDAKIGQLEITYGMVPGGGATQRLPRLVGVEKALNMIVFGKAYSAMDLKDSGLIDKIIEGDLLEGTLKFVQEILTKQSPIKRTRDIKISQANTEAFFQVTKQLVAGSVKNNPAAVKCIDAIEASVNLPFEKGMKVELDLWTETSKSPESKSLMHLFLAERDVASIPDVPSDTPLRKFDQIAVIGSGVMALGIVMSFINAKIPVVLLARSEQSLNNAVASIGKTYQDSLKKGKITEEQLEKTLALMTPTLSFDDLKNADFIIEAIIEDMQTKKELFKKLDTLAKPGAILVSNTSTLNLNQLADFTSRPQDVIGMHFFNPAHLMKLLEVVRGEKTAKDVIATTIALCKKIKKIGVVSGVCDGFIGNRIIFKYFSAANLLLEEGASPQQIDNVLEKWGMAMGPFKIQDIVGLDLLGSIRLRQYQETPDRIKDHVSDKLFSMGRFGLKTGNGWYHYEPGVRGVQIDPVVDEVLTQTRAELGIKARKITDEEIIHRCVFIMINEGAKILEEGIAIRSSDIDIVYVHGNGFPAFRGGPMNYGNTVTPYLVARTLKQYAQEKSDFWQPSSLLLKLAETGGTFN